MRKTVLFSPRDALLKSLKEPNRGNRVKTGDVSEARKGGKCAKVSSFNMFEELLRS